MSFMCKLSSLREGRIYSIGPLWADMDEQISRSSTLVTGVDNQTTSLFGLTSLVFIRSTATRAIYRLYAATHQMRLVRLGKKSPKHFWTGLIGSPSLTVVGRQDKQVRKVHALEFSLGVHLPTSSRLQE